MQPFIAITASEIIRSGDEWAPVVHGQSHTYSDAIIHAGGVPFIIPIVNNQVVLRQLYEQCQGLLLSGGADIDPVLYNDTLTSYSKNLSPDRDKQELVLLKWALDDNKPVLGICRGMQLINVAMGGSLHQDIVHSLPKALNHEKSVEYKSFNHLAHKIKINNDSQLAKILGSKQVGTNALHHQAVKKVGKGLKATAHTEDGVVEAIELPNKQFVIGIQSHPEALEAITEPSWNKLFKAFVEAAN